MPFLFTAQLFLVFGDYGVVCHFFYVRVCLKQREMLFVSSIDYILTFFVPMVEAEVKYWLLGQTWPEINDSHAFFFSSSVTMGALQRSTITAFFLLRPQHSQPEKLSAVQKKKKKIQQRRVSFTMKQKKMVWARTNRVLCCWANRKKQRLWMPCAKPVGLGNEWTFSTCRAASNVRIYSEEC